MPLAAPGDNTHILPFRLSAKPVFHARDPLARACPMPYVQEEGRPVISVFSCATIPGLTG